MSLPPARPRVDWWKLYHQAMREVPWASPEALAKVTLPQLACLMSPEPPGQGEALLTAEDYEAMLAARAAADEAWGE